ncbi:TrmH family RNA methyltransferase [Tepidibacillus sp. LV47]|uniref:TrmH family RNA methyltransferase n=1 Tax=Tepidibacillus sp. LV47 TaxID=3398228 RepID=UPI003AABA62C
MKISMNTNVEIIQSVHNPKVKSWIRLKTKQGRNEQGLFLIEGIKNVEEVLQSGQEVVSIIYGEDKEIPDSWRTKMEQSKQPIHLYQVSQHIIEKLAETKTPQGFFAIVKQELHTIETLLSHSFLLLVDEIQDPGNLGTIIRSADAAGVEGIILGDGTVDPYNGKVIRSAMGSMFHLPIVKASLDEVIPRLKESSFQVIGTSPYAKKAYFEMDYKQKTAILVGNEARGLAESRMEQVDQMVQIPFMGQAESLNVAIATSIILFERARQILKSS